MINNVQYACHAWLFTSFGRPTLQVAAHNPGSIYAISVLIGHVCVFWLYLLRLAGVFCYESQPLQSNLLHVHHKRQHWAQPQWLPYCGTFHQNQTITRMIFTMPPPALNSTICLPQALALYLKHIGPNPRFVVSEAGDSLTSAVFNHQLNRPRGYIWSRAVRLPWIFPGALILCGAPGNIQGYLDRYGEGVHS